MYRGQLIIHRESSEIFVLGDSRKLTQVAVQMRPREVTEWTVKCPNGEPFLNHKEEEFTVEPTRMHVEGFKVAPGEWKLSRYEVAARSVFLLDRGDEQVCYLKDEGLYWAVSVRNDTASARSSVKPDMIGATSISEVPFRVERAARKALEAAVAANDS